MSGEEIIKMLKDLKDNDEVTSGNVFLYLKKMEKPLVTQDDFVSRLETGQKIYNFANSLSPKARKFYFSLFVKSNDPELLNSLLSIFHCIEFTDPMVLDKILDMAIRGDHDQRRLCLKALYKYKPLDKQEEKKIYEALFKMGKEMNDFGFFATSTKIATNIDLEEGIRFCEFLKHGTGKYGKQKDFFEKVCNARIKSARNRISSDSESHTEKSSPDSPYSP